MWIERKYTTLASTKLELFKLNGNVASFRCPVCGDSKINKYKTRGIIKLTPSGSYFYCHNCKAHKKFGAFLKFLDHNLYAEYLKEVMAEKAGITENKTQELTEKIITNTPIFSNEYLRKIKKISQLQADHPARLYVEQRLIPKNQHYRLYYCPKFMSWVNTIIPGKFKNITQDEPRLIIPLIDKSNKLLGFQGRSFRKKTDLRYITIMLDENNPKIFGLDTVDFSKNVTVVEGPIDSLFLRNSLATAGGKITSEISKLPLDDNRKITVAYDNEPRNKDVVSDIERAIDIGYNVVIWPKYIRDKDVNQMIQSGINVEDVIEKNTFSGLIAKTKLSEWRVN